MRYELWQCEDGYSFFPEDNESARRMLLPGDVILATFDADTWEEASQKQYDYLGWGTYRPMEET